MKMKWRHILTTSEKIEATQLVTLAESAKMNFSIINFDHTGLWRPLAKM